jgi:hypothetical protein
VISLHGTNPEPFMSALGQKQTSDCRPLMSALPPKADIAERDQDVCFVPKADILRCSEERRLFDNLVGGNRQHQWHSQPELLVCRRRLTNSFFLKDRCSLSDQISFILASNWRAFILAMRDRDRANKNETEIFVFSVTSNDFPHDMLLLIFSLKIGAAIRCQGISGRS